MAATMTPGSAITESAVHFQKPVQFRAFLRALAEEIDSQAGADGTVFSNASTTATMAAATAAGSASSGTILPKASPI